MAAHGYRDETTYPVAGGPFQATWYCLCGQKFTKQDFSRRNARRDAKRLFNAHMKTVKKNMGGK